MIEQETRPITQAELLARLEWSGYKDGPGCGPMDSGPGSRYAACPLCRGLKEPNHDFSAEAVGHRPGCDFLRVA